MDLNEAQKDFDDAAFYVRRENIDDNLKKEKVSYYQGLAHLAKALENLENLLKSIQKEAGKKKE